MGVQTIRAKRVDIVLMRAVMINYTQENELTLWWKHKGIQLKSDELQKRVDQLSLYLSMELSELLEITQGKHK